MQNWKSRCEGSVLGWHALLIISVYLAQPTQASDVQALDVLDQDSSGDATYPGCFKLLRVGTSCPAGSEQSVKDRQSAARICAGGGYNEFVYRKMLPPADPRVTCCQVGGSSIAPEYDDMDMYAIDRTCTPETEHPLEYTTGESYYLVTSGRPRRLATAEQCNQYTNMPYATVGGVRTLAECAAQNADNSNLTLIHSPKDTCRPREMPTSSLDTRAISTTGMCQGQLVYSGWNGDNPGTLQEKKKRCAQKCFNKGCARGWAMVSSTGLTFPAGSDGYGRCYCNIDDQTNYFSMRDLAKLNNVNVKYECKDEPAGHLFKATAYLFDESQSSVCKDGGGGACRSGGECFVTPGACRDGKSFPGTRIARAGEQSSAYAIGDCDVDCQSQRQPKGCAVQSCQFRFRYPSASQRERESSNHPSAIVSSSYEFDCTPSSPCLVPSARCDGNKLVSGDAPDEYYRCIVLSTPDKIRGREAEAKKPGDGWITAYASACSRVGMYPLPSSRAQHSFQRSIGLGLGQKIPDWPSGMGDAMPIEWPSPWPSPAGIRLVPVSNKAHKRIEVFLKLPVYLSTETCGDDEITDETSCQAAAAALDLSQPFLAGAEWQSGCLYHGGKVYFSPHVDGSRQDAADQYICDPVNGVWGTVCDDSFGLNDANVACRQLGLGSALSKGKVGGGVGEILLDDLACSGSESRLENCTHRGVGISNCQHEEDVGVTCELKGEMTNATKGLQQDIPTRFCTVSYEPRSLECTSTKGHPSNAGKAPSYLSFTSYPQLNSDSDYATSFADNGNYNLNNVMCYHTRPKAIPPETPETPEPTYHPTAAPTEPTNHPTRLQYSLEPNGTDTCSGGGVAIPVKECRMAAFEAVPPIGPQETLGFNARDPLVQHIGNDKTAPPGCSMRYNAPANSSIFMSLVMEPRTYTEAFQHCVNLGSHLCTKTEAVDLWPKLVTSRMGEHEFTAWMHDDPPTPRVEVNRRDPPQNWVSCVADGTTSTAGVPVISCGTEKETKQSTLCCGILGKYNAFFNTAPDGRNSGDWSVLCKADTTTAAPTLAPTTPADDGDNPADGDNSADGDNAADGGNSADGDNSADRF